VKYNWNIITKLSTIRNSRPSAVLFYFSVSRCATGFMQSDADKSRPNRGCVVWNGGSFILGRDGEGLLPPRLTFDVFVCEHSPFWCMMASIFSAYKNFSHLTGNIIPLATALAATCSWKEKIGRSTYWMTGKTNIYKFYSSFSYSLSFCTM